MHATQLAGQRAAQRAGLHYVCNESAGISRHRSGSGFRYIDATGHVVRVRAELERIRALAIPPAWRDVWICTDLLSPTAAHPIFLPG
ncbi:hypothetical protein [Chitinimonas sp. BJB300]|uniref:hypothetical protein n=1 Tax=Chitinimonas sp. BJB300 TaxID=1559339 RepID=UPI000C0F9654|nr:hypothetical protein [Chitinimonas sp. BJB300]PHV09632.1 hypothetical protein CSQ89_20620 [Chitinimonas sp. BJB300]TSJ90155.1 hypothetical protein FG002_008265 [Chitinimonas sp. BJB300]